MSTTITLVQCGSKKSDEPTEARDMYESNYFRRKRRVAELLGDRWFVLSAEHELLPPDERIDPYDTEIDDVDPVVWADHVRAQLHMVAPSWQQVEIVVLAGRDYREPVIDALPDEWDVSSPFDGLGGIPGQQRWLSDRLDELVVDDGDDGDDDADVDGRSPRVLQCSRCRQPTWHDVVDAESVEGTAWQCSSCLIVRETAQPTLASLAQGDRP